MSEVSQYSEVAYTKARFFKCALQVNPARYIKYRGRQQSVSEDEYNQELLEEALNAGVEVIGLAHHGSIDGTEKLRELFTQHGLLVFPGFEIASSEKIHFVCLFDESTSSDLLKMHLGALGVDIDQPEMPIRKSALELINSVNEKGGFVYAAHSTNDDGVLKRRMNHVWRDEGLLAAQLPGPIEDLKGVEDDFYRKVFLNKDPNYRRERPIAAINAADVSRPEEITADSASCLVKMTRPCFSSFKQALKDPESRVRLNSDKPEHYASAIEQVRFVGGYLDNVEVEFSEHLNAIIGGRGAGKSTLLECIRFALGDQPFGQSAKQQHNAVLKANLGAERGRVELFVRSAAMHGRRFKISRRYGDKPVVLDEENNVSPHQPHDLLPGLELFGQNEIYEMTRDPESRSQLVDRFLGEGHDIYEETVARILQRLKENRESIGKELELKNEVEADVERLPRLQDQEKQFRELGLDQKLKAIPMLEKEKQLSANGSEALTRFREKIEELKDSLPDTTFLSDSALEGLPHAELLRNQKALLDSLTEEAGQFLNRLEEAQLQSTDGLTAIQQQLQESIEAQEQELEKAYKTIPASQGKTGPQIGAEYHSLLQQIARIKPKERSLKSHQAQIDSLYQERKKLLFELSEAGSARAAAMQTSVRRLNRRLEDKVRVTLNNEGIRKPLFDLLYNCNLEGVGSKRLLWVYENDFSPAALAEHLRCGADSLQQAGYGVTRGVAQALCSLPEQKVLEMEELVLPDTVSIELNVTHGEQEAWFREIDDLSTGQQCTAVLHLLLLDNEDPLILDQPEDNLDNAFIAERIVTELRNAKLTRQFMFATHNANIPVFGDAEWIGVLSVEDKKGQILPEQQGAIDLPTIQRLAADILEGGEAAFNQRRQKYGFE